MTQEQYNKAIEISENIKCLEKVKKEINYPNYDHRLSYIEHSQISHDNNWKPCEYMAYIGDILDKHDKMIRKEIDEGIKNLYKEIEKL